ncbi:hypothetical protein BH11BAC3_BH11BAC3_28760 [soil metagenome]
MEMYILIYLYNISSHNLDFWKILISRFISYLKEWILLLNYMCRHDDDSFRIYSDLMPYFT